MLHDSKPVFMNENEKMPLKKNKQQQQQQSKKERKKEEKKKNPTKRIHIVCTHYTKT